MPFFSHLRMWIKNVEMKFLIQQMILWTRLWAIDICREGITQCSSVFLHNEKWPNSIKFLNIYRILIPLNLSNFTQRYQLLRNGWNRTILISKPIFSLLQEESVMRYLTVSLFFFPLIVKAQLTDQRFKPAAIYIMEHRNLLPRPDLSDRSSNLKQLNLCLKEHFGERLVLHYFWFHLS